MSLPGRNVHYLDVGAGGPPLVLLHAFPLNSAMWAPQIACLSAGRRVIAPDLIGFGQSDQPANPLTSAMSDLSGDVAALVDHLGTGPVVVAGLSMGGYAALDLVRRRPDMVAALVLADTRAAADTPEVADRRRAQQQQISLSGTDGVIPALLGGLLGQTTQTDRPALVDQVRAMMTVGPAAAYLGALEAMMNRPDSTPDLAGIDVPTLVLVGAEDTLSPPTSVREWQNRIRGSELVVLPRAGHLSNMEAPEEFNAAVGAFLDALPATP